MCAGAIFWSGVGRVVFALSNSRLYALTRDTPDRLLEGCADVLSKGTHRVEVVGPMIEEEAEQVFKKQSGMPNVIAH
jgi:tRNA(Arg) A34 adenosine deaminase TadA